MIQDILVQQMRLIDQEDGKQVLLGKVLHAARDSQKHVPSAVIGAGQTERCAYLAIEVAPANSHVVAVRQPKCFGLQGLAHGAHKAGLAGSRLAAQ